MIELSKKIIQPEEAVENFADRLGYTELIFNPDYVPAVGPETIDDTSATPTRNEMGFDVYPQIPNPDHVPAVGEPTLPNKDRVDWVSDKVEDLLTEFLGQFADADEHKAAMVEADAKAAATKEVIKSTIVTERIQ